MKIAILSRSGDCFPNIISIGLAEMLNKENVDAEIIHEAIPMLMRLLPLSEKNQHWTNNLQFRIRNKIKFYFNDKNIINRLGEYDAVILSECLPNAYWKNYYDIEGLSRIIKKPILSYTDSSLTISPLHKKMWLNSNDYDENRYFLNLCPSNTVEIFKPDNDQLVSIGVNISNSGLKVVEKKEFIALIDFAQSGYESYREEQINALSKLGIKTIELNGRYSVEEIRNLYKKAAVFFMAFPETFGLPIAECLATGCMIFTPSSSWPMAWRLNKDAKPWGSGILPECFQVYENENNLIEILSKLKNEYHPKETPQKVNNIFMEHYKYFFCGNQETIRKVIQKLKNNRS